MYFQNWKSYTLYKRYKDDRVLLVWLWQWECIFPWTERLITAAPRIFILSLISDSGSQLTWPGYIITHIPFFSFIGKLVMRGTQLFSVTVHHELDNWKEPMLWRRFGIMRISVLKRGNFIKFKVYRKDQIYALCILFTKKVCSVSVFFYQVMQKSYNKQTPSSIHLCIISETQL